MWIPARTDLPWTLQGASIQLNRGAPVAKRQADKSLQLISGAVITVRRHDRRSWRRGPGVWIITRFRVITWTRLTRMLAGQTRALPATIRQRLAGEPDAY